MRAIKDYNVYQIDDFLINIGGFISIFFGFMLLIGIWFYSRLVMIFAFCGGLACLACGGYIRLLERRVNGVARALERINDTTLAQFTTATGYSEKQVLSSLQVINNRGLGFYSIDPKTGRISDARLAQTVAFADVCSQCSKKVVGQYSMQLESIPTCPYCGSPLDMDKWAELKQNTLSRFASGESGQSAAAGQPQGVLGAAGKGQPPFNMGVLVVLLILFWPLGVGYLLTSYSRSKLPAFKS